MRVKIQNEINGSLCKWQHLCDKLNCLQLICSVSPFRSSKECRVERSYRLARYTFYWSNRQSHFIHSNWISGLYFTFIYTIRESRIRFRMQMTEKKCTFKPERLFLLVNIVWYISQKFVINLLEIYHLLISWCLVLFATDDEIFYTNIVIASK